MPAMLAAQCLPGGRGQNSLGWTGAEVLRKRCKNRDVCKFASRQLCSKSSCSWITALRASCVVGMGTYPHRLSQLHHNGLHGSTNSVAAVVTEEAGMTKNTDPKLFAAIETAIASGNTVYLVSSDYQSMGDGPELMRNSALIKGRHGEFPADAFHTVNRINSCEC